MYTVKNMIDSLNKKLTPTSVETLNLATIEQMLREEIEAVFGINENVNYQQIDMSKLKKTYHELSRQLNTDHKKNDDYLKALKTKNLDGLPHTSLNTIWGEITKKHLEPQEDIKKDTTNSFSNYYPLNFAQNKINELFSVFVEMSKCSEDDQKEVMFREKFPELFYYEKYPEEIQYFIYGFQFIINVGLISISLIPVLIIPLLTRLLNNILTYPLLNFSTDSRYLQHDALLLTIKTSLKDRKISFENIEDNEIRDIFDVLLKKTTAAQLNLIEEYQFDAIHPHELDLYFKCIYVIQNLPNYHDNIFNEFKKTLDKINPPIENQVKVLVSSNQELIEEAYAEIRKNEEISIAASCKQNFLLITVSQQLQSIAKASYEMANDKALPIFERIFRGIVLIVSAPIILTSCFVQLLCSVSLDILMAIKLILVELINSPLKIHSYFNTSKSEPLSHENTNSAGNRPNFEPIM